MRLYLYIWVQIYQYDGCESVIIKLLEYKRFWFTGVHRKFANSLRQLKGTEMHVLYACTCTYKPKMPCFEMIENIYNMTILMIIDFLNLFL